MPSRRCMPLFQSTHPLRGATSLSEYVPTPSIFQSTHPLRGATASMRSTSISPINFNPRTPCGVRLMNERVNITLEGFQSTHPLRGATDSKRLFLRGYEISIHAPLAGCDVRGRRDRRGLFHISIHAPLAGCDSPHGAFQNKVVNFNPRTPCGVRQQNCRNIPGKFAQKLQNFCKAEQRAALPRVGQRESGCYFRPCAVRTSRGKPECFRFASDNERALRSVARL